jgi:Tfp pilus assembly protein PilX
MSPRLRPTRLLAGERGQSLVMALVVLTFLAISLSTVLIFTASNQRTSNYSKSAQVANSLAEAGVNNAISILANPNNSATVESSTLLPSTEAAAIAAGDTKTGATAYQTGTTVTWWGTLQNPAPNGNVVWTVHGKATVPNPTGPSAAPVVKTMSAMLNVNPPASNNFQVGVWNTVYSPFGPSAGCDTSIGQGINISVPLYVGGNLCMGQNAVVTKPTYVGGFLFFQNKQGSIGSNNATINSAHVGGYCQVSSGAQVNPCKSEPVGGNNPNTNIWVTGAPTNLTGPASDFANIQAPKICWSGAASEVASGACTNTPPGGWYTFASPGPYHPCAAGSSGTTPNFDADANGVAGGQPPNGMNDTYQNTVFNLTPAASYTCQTGQGLLMWDATNRVLTVSGTIFFDGSITMTTSGNQPITYTGTGSGGACTANGDCQSVIYAAGDISINSEKLCAKLNAQANDCDWNNWDPNKKILIFASNGPTGVTVGPSQTSFEGGLYATNTVATGQSAVTEGPLVSGTKTVVLGQQFGGTFPPITILPFAIQQQPGGFYVSPPDNFKYGS